MDNRGEFASFVNERKPVVEKLAKEAGNKGEQAFQEQALALKAAMESGSRKTVGEAIKKIEGAAKGVKDESLKKKLGPFVRNVRGEMGNLLDKVFAGGNLLAALYILIFFWILAAMCSHIPNRGEQMVRYYGYYSNVARGKRKKECSDDAIPCILEPQVDVKAFRKSWARLIQKIYEVDPLICPKTCPELVEGCQGSMRIISAIDDRQVIRAILEHLGLWRVRSRPPPKIHDPPIREYAAADHPLQTHADTIYGDPEYTWDEYIQS